MSIIVKTQAELDAAIAAGSQGIIIDSPPNKTLTLRGNTHATLRGSSHAILVGNSRATLVGNSRATLWDSSHATLWDSSHAELRGDSSGVLWDSSHATLRDSSHATLRDSSHATLWDSSHAELRGDSSGVLWDSSHAVLRDSSHATLVGNSRATLVGNSRATLVGDSSAVLWGNSSADASGASSLRLHDWSSVTAGPLVAVHRYSGLATVQGGVLIDLSAVQETDPAVWREAHGVTVTDGVAILYKATDSDLTAGHGHRLTSYDVGSEPVAADFQADHGCGRGLHLSPTAQQASVYRPDAVRWVRVEVPVGEIVPIPSLLSGQVAKCKVRTCRVVAEVDVLGRDIPEMEGLR